MLAEASTAAISKKRLPRGLPANKQVARQGGKIAGNARKALEKRLKRPIVSRQNYLKERESQKRIKKGE